MRSCEWLGWKTQHERTSVIATAESHCGLLAMAEEAQHDAATAADKHGQRAPRSQCGHVARVHLARDIVFDPRCSILLFADEALLPADLCFRGPNGALGHGPLLLRMVLGGDDHGVCVLDADVHIALKGSQTSGPP